MVVMLIIIIMAPGSAVPGCKIVHNAKPDITILGLEFKMPGSLIGRARHLGQGAKTPRLDLRNEGLGEFSLCQLSA